MNESMIDSNYMQMYSLYKLGSIKGNLKFEKVCYELKEALLDNGCDCGQNFEFKREEFGPRSPGLSKANMKFEVMGLQEIENLIDDSVTIYTITEKGKMWIGGLTQFYKKTISNFDILQDLMNQSLEENKDLSGSQIVKKDKVQKAKKELWNKKV